MAGSTDIGTDRPVRRACDPGEFGLVSEATFACADALQTLRFERTDVASQTRFFEDFGFVSETLPGELLGFRGEFAGDPLVEIVPSSRDRLAQITFGLCDEEYERALAHANEKGARAADDHLLIAAPGGIELKLVRSTPARPSIEIQSPEERAPNLESNAWIASSRIAKIGHIVLQSRDPVGTALFYKRWLGLIPTDIQTLPSGKPVVVFLRLDRGQSPTDHHTLVVGQSYKEGFDHAAFETVSLDDVGFGHQYLKAKGWKHSWGIGRHWLGGQFFDYWRDPAGAHFEHYAGSDTYTADFPAQHTEFSLGTLYSWGHDLPKAFTPTPKLRELPGILSAIRRGELDWRVLQEMQAVAKNPPRPWIK